MRIYLIELFYLTLDRHETVLHQPSASTARGQAAFNVGYAKDLWRGFHKFVAYWHTILVATFKLAYRSDDRSDIYFILE